MRPELPHGWETGSNRGSTYVREIGDERLTEAPIRGPTGCRREKGRSGRRRRLAGAPGRGAPAEEKPPILGLIQRGGRVVLRMLAGGRQRTIRPVIEAVVAEGASVHTAE